MATCMVLGRDGGSERRRCVAAVVCDGCWLAAPSGGEGALCDAWCARGGSAHLVVEVHCVVHGARVAAVRSAW